MAYRVEIRRSVNRKINSWVLPDTVLVEVHLRLCEVLPENPAEHLRRARHPFDGMVYEFSFIDPENRLCEYSFYFLVQYSQDEASLVVVNGGYLRRVGI